MRLCPYCRNEVSMLPPDSIDYCGECDLVVEGEVEDVSDMEVRE